MFLKSTGTDDITFYCILDSDYHLPDEIEARYRDALKKDIQLHIWGKKEIENYLLVPSALARYINKMKKQNIANVSVELVSQKISDIENSEEIKFHILNCLADEFLKKDRPGGLPKANRSAKDFMDSLWSSNETKQSVIPGKKIFSKFSGWSKSEYDVSISTNAIASELMRDEIDNEVYNVISAIQNLKQFDAY